MITETIIGLLAGIVIWVVSVTPDFGLDLHLDLAGGFTAIGHAAMQLNGWFPVAVLAGCLVTVLTVQAVLTAWGAVVWVYHQFWGSD